MDGGGYCTGTGQGGPQHKPPERSWLFKQASPSPGAQPRNFRGVSDLPWLGASVLRTVRILGICDRSSLICETCIHDGFLYESEIMQQSRNRWFASSHAVAIFGHDVTVLRTSYTTWFQMLGVLRTVWIPFGNRYSFEEFCLRGYGTVRSMVSLVVWNSIRISVTDFTI